MAIKDRTVVTASGCQEWTGAIGSHGYGNVNVGDKYWKSHRRAWAEGRGEIPEGMCVLHACDNRKCCNLDHLFLGTKLDNARDMMRKGRGVKARGEDHGIAKLTSEDVSRIREAYAYGARQVDLGSVYGVAQTGISRIIRRESWKHV